MMKRNNVSATVVETYLESYHGKSYRLGFPERAAGCADCHSSAHSILPKSDPASSINQHNLVATCAKCHSRATALLTKFYAHGNHSDRHNYPILYYTFLGMTGLLVSTFAVFWIHTLLWMFRGFVENRQRVAALAMGAVELAAVEHAIPDAHKLYQRFQKRHILLHLTVIISFLGLSLTGLPLKFSDQPWAKTFMSFYGGVHYAGLIHRACAVLTFYYFFGALVMSFDFLFVRKDVRGNWLQRLFGPDSLMPNLRDARDVAGMVRWFLFRGPKPNFERWTYWEKFDFLAVFWGMFAIGGSGLMLWFPEFFTRLLPGWALNVATIVHSDEALLATGFIFTVHFFNTHGRPEKFPMDFVIFNGQITKEEFIEERGDQWKRYEEAGVTEQFKVPKPSGILYDFVLKGFGFLALFTGLTLACLMFYAFVGR
jgi:cytochrome b subunit of formate dehydrogenase